MKVTLNLGELLAAGQISQSEHDKLQTYSSRTTGQLALSIIIAFGVLAVSSGAIMLVPDPTTAIACGAGIGLLGMAMLGFSQTLSKLLSNIIVLIGALLFAGGILVQGEGSNLSILIVAATFVGTSIISRSSLMMVLGVLAISATLGAYTGYRPATYILGIAQPLTTVIAFSALALVSYVVSLKVPLNFQGISIIAARTSIFLVNLGFWVGSIWGDRARSTDLVISDATFSITWAIALLGVGIWAWSQNRRWLVNIAAVFGGIHFYTQWFESFGTSPETILVGGILMLVLGLILAGLNAKLANRIVD